MRFVAVKTAEQQSVLMVHRTRQLLVRQRTMVVNAIRARMAEFGVVARVGLPQVGELLAVTICSASATSLPVRLWRTLRARRPGRDEHSLRLVR